MKAMADIRRAAFTLVELLAVVAIIAVLTGIVIPTAGMARVSARRARTKVQFAQWAAAFELFRQEYGHMPVVDSGGLIDGGRFILAMTGRASDGTEPAGGTEADLAGNVRRLRFYSPSAGEVEADEGGAVHLVDGFGNRAVAVVCDRDQDGFVRVGADCAGLPAVCGVDCGAGLRPSGDEFPGEGVRASVIFYSAGAGRHPGDLVMSWR